jgi:hypothetical protein
MAGMEASGGSKEYQVAGSGVGGSRSIKGGLMEDTETVVWFIFLLEFLILSPSALWPSPFRSSYYHMWRLVWATANTATGYQSSSEYLRDSRIHQQDTETLLEVFSRSFPVFNYDPSLPSATSYANLQSGMLVAEGTWIGWAVEAMRRWLW